MYRNGTYIIVSMVAITCFAGTVWADGAVYAMTNALANKESPDGRYLYYVRSDSSPGIRRRRIADSYEELLPGAEGVQLFRYWSVSRSGIFFVAGPTDPFLRFLALRNNLVSRVARVSPNLIKGPRGLAASPGGSTILYTVEDIAAADIMLGRM